MFLWRDGNDNIRPLDRLFPNFFFFFKMFIYLFGCTGSFFVVILGLSLVAVSRGHSLVVVCRLLTVVASPVVVCGLSSPGTRA